MAEEDNSTESLAAKETRRINVLRAITLFLLLTLAATASVGVYVFSSNSERQKFETDFAINAQRFIDTVQNVVQLKLEASAMLADSITSHALSSGEQFPMITLPNFVVHGSNVRVSAESTIVQWCPLVTDETRAEWEEYALEQRFQMDDAYEEDSRLRDEQDKEFGLSLNYSVPLRNYSDDNTLQDGTYYHSRIWSNGVNSPRGDEPNGTGPFLPLWQRSPVFGSRRQSILNFNMAGSQTLAGTLEPLLKTKEAVMNTAEVPTERAKLGVAENLLLSQYREDSVENFSDPATFISYPVFDSFQKNREVAGVLVSNCYWRLLFENILPKYAKYRCVLENNFNQSFTYLVDGSKAQYVGAGDLHSSRYDGLAKFGDINKAVQSEAKVRTRSYTMVPLNSEYGSYRLRVYPTEETEDYFTTNKPWVYTLVVFILFLITVIILITLDRIIARRQRIVMEQVIKVAEEKATFEHEMNQLTVSHIFQFLAHEVRNPIAAAISAHGFVAATVDDMVNKAASDDQETLSSLQEDVRIIGSSLYFIDDFLRSMLDLHASTANALEANLAPSDLLKDVLEPVRSILHRRDGRIDILVDCPEELILVTDCLRLKQIMMNLGRNSLKFTSEGFVRFRVVVVEDLIQLYVEDSGPGIPVKKRENLFAKFQESLDVLSQGTGIGLSLCESLTKLLNGRIYLDENYDSGVPGSPGARFVVELNQRPLSAESILSAEKQDSSDELATGDTDSAKNSALERESTFILPEGFSVLFVDDDCVLRKLFCRAVKKAAPSWNVSEAASGEAAIELVTSDLTSYSIIFMDQYMSSTEKQLLGTDTVRELRARGVDCTICGLSANKMEDDFLRSGADAFLLKPFPCDQDAMQRELARICSSRSVI